MDESRGEREGRGREQQKIEFQLRNERRSKKQAGMQAEKEGRKEEKKKRTGEEGIKIQVLDSFSRCACVFDFVPHT